MVLRGDIVYIYTQSISSTDSDLLLSKEINVCLEKAFFKTVFQRLARGGFVAVEVTQVSIDNTSNVFHSYALGKSRYITTSSFSWHFCKALGSVCWLIIEWMV